MLLTRGVWGGCAHQKLEDFEFLQIHRAIWWIAYVLIKFRQNLHMYFKSILKMVMYTLDVCNLIAESFAKHPNFPNEWWRNWWYFKLERYWKSREAWKCVSWKIFFTPACFYKFVTPYFQWINFITPRGGARVFLLGGKVKMCEDATQSVACRACATQGGVMGGCAPLRSGEIFENWNLKWSDLVNILWHKNQYMFS